MSFDLPVSRKTKPNSAAPTPAKFQRAATLDGSMGRVSLFAKVGQFVRGGRPLETA